MNIYKESSAEEAKKSLARHLSQELLRLKHGHTPTLLLFSGGSALGIFDALEGESLGEFLTMVPIDERYDPSEETSNFAAFMKTGFYETAKGTGTHFIDTRVRKGQGHDELANFFEQSLKGWIERNKEGNILAILGMGADGHTMGVFPREKKHEFEALFEAEKLSVGYRAGTQDLCPERITTTISFMRHHADRVFVFCTGEEKQRAWERLMMNKEPLHLLPIGIAQSLQRVEVFTDLSYNRNATPNVACNHS